MGIFDNYKREVAAPFAKGLYRLEIKSAEETLTKKTSLPMLKFELQINGTKQKIMHYIVKNEYFNRNMTEFMDSFNIDENDHDIIGWGGAIGVGQLELNDDGYPKVKYFVSGEKAEKAPAWVGAVPERAMQNTAATPSIDESDLPF